MRSYDVAPSFSKTSRRETVALEAFEINMADAHHLVRIAEALTNTRVRRMRRELRQRVGAALRIPAGRQSELDCLESRDLFVAFKPASAVRRSDFDDARPLLRQAIVAGCAATETYLADRAMDCVGRLMNQRAATKRLRDIPLTLGAWMDVDAGYSVKKASGLKYKVVGPYVRELASTSPSKVGYLLSLLGVENWQTQIDGKREVAKGDTSEQLERITKRRNKIAHEGDRRGAGRAQVTTQEVLRDLGVLESLVQAVHSVTDARFFSKVTREPRD